MPRERLPMRKIRDVLRLHAGGLSKRRIAAGLNIGRTAAGDYIKRAGHVGLSWPLPDGLSDEDLDRQLFPPAPVVSAHDRPPPNWPRLKRTPNWPRLIWSGPKSFGRAILLRKLSWIQRKPTLCRLLHKWQTRSTVPHYRVPPALPFRATPT